MSRRKMPVLLFISLVISILGMLITGTALTAATQKVTVSVTPKRILLEQGTQIDIGISVSAVSDLNKFGFSLVYDPAVLRISGDEGADGIYAGQITNTAVVPNVSYSIPITWQYAVSGTQGEAQISGNLGATTGKGAFGVGSLIKIKFEVIGDYGSTGNIEIRNLYLRQSPGALLQIDEIENGAILVAYPPVSVSIDVPSSLPAGDNFTADVNVSLIKGVSAYQFDLQYDPDVLRVVGDECGEGVIGGSVGGTELPVFLWMYNPAGQPGRIRVLGGTVDGMPATGSGTLASISFESVGQKGDISPLQFINTCALFYYYKNVADVSWNSSSVEFLAAYRFTNASTLTIGEVGLPYTRTLLATGGEAPYSYSVVSGSLPAGLNLTAEGQLSGIPQTAGGPFSFTLMATDSTGATVSKVFKVTIAAPVAINTTAALPNGEIGYSYYKVLSAATGVTPYTWSIISGNIPSGLTFTSTGVINGTPLAAGDYFFTAQVSDKLNGIATRDFSLHIAELPQITSTSPITSAEIGLPYSNALQHSGGLAPFTWAIQSGALPAGLSLNTSTGTISGTPTRVGGPYNITFKVTDSLASSATRTLAISVVRTPSIATASPLTGAETGVAYYNKLLVSGGVSPYTWTVAKGNLPAGLTLSADGVLYGTPLVITKSTAITFQATDSAGGTATKALNLSVIKGMTIASTSPLASGKVGLTYSRKLAASGGLSPYVWTVSSGILPPGLTLNSSTGLISGKPTILGTYNFTIKLADSLGSITKTFTIIIEPPPSIDTDSTLAEGSVATRYSQTLTASNGSAPYRWSMASGSLPSGLSLGSRTGVISGSPKVAGTRTFNVKVTDNSGGTQTKSFTITIISAVTINTRTISGGEIGMPYSQALAASGGRTPYNWSLQSGTLPAGLTLDVDSGIISGTPTTSAKSKIVVKITDSINGTDTQSLTLSVIPAVGITTTALPDGEVGLKYSTRLSAKGGKTPYTWSLVSGELPAGLAFNSRTATLSGKPVVPVTKNLTFQVVDALKGTQQITLALSVIPGPEISTTALSDGKIKNTYQQTLSAGGGVQPYKWTVSSGKLPTGLKLNANTGVIYGTPSAACDSRVIVFKVTDKMKANSLRPLTLTITAPPSISTTSLVTGKVGRYYSRTLTVTGGQAPYTWSVQAGTLPEGLTLNSANGQISGTPAAYGKFRITFRVEDANGDAAVRTLTLSISK